MGKSGDINGYSSIALYCGEENSLVLQNTRPTQNRMSCAGEPTFVLPYSCKSQYQNTVKLFRTAEAVGVLCVIKETILERDLEFSHNKILRISTDKSIRPPTPTVDFPLVVFWS
jgi:hypothetical protein